MTAIIVSLAACALSLASFAVKNLRLRVAMCTVACGMAIASLTLL